MMEVTKLTQEGMAIPSVQNAFLNQKGDDLSVNHGTANTMSRAKYEDLFSLVQYGTEISDARLYSPELLWNDVKLMEVPVGWPNRMTDDGEGGQRVKLMGEYTRIVRSLTDPTKCMLKYAQSPRVLEYIDQQNLQDPWEWIAMTHEVLMLFYDLWGFSTKTEAQAWKDINVPTE